MYVAFLKFRKFNRLSNRQKRLFFEALFFLLLTRILLLILPLKSVMKISFRKKIPIIKYDPNLLLEIKKALQRADSFFPWKRKCLTDSIAGRWMLQTRGIKGKISFGVKLNGTRDLLAHAWLTAGKFEIVEMGRNYIELVRY